MDIEELRISLIEVFEAVRQGRIPAAITPTNILLSDEEFFTEEDLPKLEHLLREEFNLRPHDTLGQEAERVGGREDVGLWVYFSEGEGVVYYFSPDEI